MSQIRVLVACECSDRVKMAFRKHGFDAWSCDLKPSENNEPHHIQGNVLTHLTDGWDMMIAHPPCTYLTVTGNKWFQPEYLTRFPERVQDRVDGVNFFMRLAAAPVNHIAIENPLGIMSTLWRKPDQIIQPYYFGHKEAKKTCLWLKDLPKLRYGDGIQIAIGEEDCPPRTKVETPEYTTFASGKRMATWYVNAAREENRDAIRSRTFEGVAEAMADQ